MARSRAATQKGNTGISVRDLIAGLLKSISTTDAGGNIPTPQQVAGGGKAEASEKPELTPLEQVSKAGVDELVKIRKENIREAKEAGSSDGEILAKQSQIDVASKRQQFTQNQGAAGMQAVQALIQQAGSQQQQKPITFEERIRGLGPLGRGREGFVEGLLQSIGVDRTKQAGTAAKIRKGKDIDFKDLALKSISTGKPLAGFTPQQTQILAGLKSISDKKLTLKDAEVIIKAEEENPGFFSFLDSQLVKDLRKNPEILRVLKEQVGLTVSGVETAEKAVSKVKGSLKDFKTEQDARDAGFGKGDRVSIGGQSGRLD